MKFFTIIVCFDTSCYFIKKKRINLEYLVECLYLMNKTTAYKNNTTGATSGAETV